MIPAVGFLTALFIALVAGPIGRRLWFDELFTFYIARAPSLARLFDGIAHVDLNPPLIYLLVRLFHSLFGTSELVTRLPAAIGFYLGSLGVLVFLQRRIGVLWGTAAVLLFWSTPYFRLATQARPYGLLFGFFALSLVSYDRRSVKGLAAGNIGMMLSHVFAPLSMAPFGAAELVRTIKTRRIDWPVWAALVLPLLISLAYIPVTRNFQKFWFPDAFQASGDQMLHYYVRLMFLYMYPAGIVGIGLALLAIPFTKFVRRSLPGGLPAVLWSLALLVTPVALNLVLMHSGGAFWERYCMTSALAFYILLVIGLGWVTGFRTSSGLAACLAFAAVTVATPFPPDSQLPEPGAVEAIPGDLPIVSASGLSFMEMDRYLKSSVLSRVYYLVDRPSAIAYAHATIFENLPTAAQDFPLRAHVEPYYSFLKAHRHFLVIDRPDYMEDWLLRKLCDDGASIRLRSTLPGPEREFLLYEVNF